MPVEGIQEGIKHGMRKVNIDTDIRLCMTGAMRRLMGRKPEEFDPRKLLAEAVKAAKELCQARFGAFGSAGMASRTEPRPAGVDGRLVCRLAGEARGLGRRQGNAAELCFIFLAMSRACCAPSRSPDCIFRLAMLA